MSLIKSDSPTTNATGQQSNKFIWSVLYNLVAVAILVIFFFIVRFVLRETNMFGNNASPWLQIWSIEATASSQEERSIFFQIVQMHIYQLVYIFSSLA